MPETSEGFSAVINHLTGSYVAVMLGYYILFRIYPSSVQRSSQ